MIDSFVAYARQNGLDFNELPLDYQFHKRKKIEDGHRITGVYQCGYSIVVFRTDLSSSGVTTTVVDDVQVRTDVQSGGWHATLPPAHDEGKAQSKIIQHLRTRNNLLALEVELTRANPFHDTPKGLIVKPGPSGKWIVILHRKMTSSQWESCSQYLQDIVPTENGSYRIVIGKAIVDKDVVNELIKILE